MKARTNVSIDSVMLEKAKSYNIQLSALFEGALRDRLRQCAAQAWLEESRDAIEAYNTTIEANGTFSDSVRTF